MSNDSSDDNVPLQDLINTSKKKRIRCSVLEASKHLSNHTYETGMPCNCSNLRCFDVINSSKRQALNRNFNKMKDRNEQNAYLCGLISMKDICRRCPRKDESSTRLRDKSCPYKVRIQYAEGPFEEISVCQAAFISLHGVTNRRLCTIKWYMKTKVE
ncbi:hypothetical protein ILUMI_06590 [Ignelater luminosus]|uniref:Uncharacterized protein n=1 Tax=Ignelater luminosus TaxID=2038154 RepID=A0A8K0D9N0_IGNLU|nr:hypothetical protein ILUMI_06590 [Ignelater luminosus]